MTRRITQLYNRPWTNRFAFWLYEKWCNEPFVPDGTVSVRVIEKGMQNESVDSVSINFNPRKFTPGNHFWHIHGQIPERYQIEIISKKE